MFKLNNFHFNRGEKKGYFYRVIYNENNFPENIINFTGDNEFKRKLDFQWEIELDTRIVSTLLSVGPVVGRKDLYLYNLIFCIYDIIIMNGI